MASARYSTFPPLSSPSRTKAVTPAQCSCGERKNQQAWSPGDEPGQGRRGQLGLALALPLGRRGVAEDLTGGGPGVPVELQRLRAELGQPLGGQLDDVEQRF